MSAAKKLLTVLLAVLVAAAVFAGIRWNRDNYVLVDLHFYPKNEAVLDLRGKNLPVPRYEKLKALLPDCRILWDVPLSGGSADSSATEITLSTLTEEDLALLDYLPDLCTVEADSCRDYDLLLQLERLRPELELRYRIRLGEGVFARDAEEIVLRNVPAQELSRLDNMTSLMSVICTGAATDDAIALREACARRHIGFSIRVGDRTVDQEERSLELTEASADEATLLVSLPDLQQLRLIRPKASGQELQALVRANPHIRITWEAEAFGILCSSDDEDLDLSGAKITDLSRLEDALEYFPNAKTIFLGKTDIGNETLAAHREKARDRYKLVWTVQLGKKLTARTDDTTFMPVREYVYYFNDEEAYNLRYCEDMVCIDIGHMSIHNIDFVEYMPDLEYLILAHTQLTDISPISSCKKLKFLELDWSPVRDLSPLTGCTALEDLNLGNTYASFEPIKEMTWLKNLWVIGCSSGTAYKMSQALPDTKVQGAGDATVASGWRSLPNYYDMRDLLGMHYMSW